MSGRPDADLKLPGRSIDHLVTRAAVMIRVNPFDEALVVAT